jgi:hypothetical protein
MVRALVLAVAAMAAHGELTAAATVTLTMDDLPTQSVDGLVHPAGVMFGFTVNSVGNFDARYRIGGPGQITYVQDPSIEGTTLGVLSLTFSSPTPLLEFGVARSIQMNVLNGAAVELFDAGNVSLGVTSLALVRTPGFAEAKFAYNGVPVKRATVNFTTAAAQAGGPRFAFDNLKFSVVPEPTAAALAAFSLTGVNLLRVSARRRERRFQMTR